VIHKTLYEILGVAVHATDAQIKRAFRKRVKRAHPDAGGDADKFREINHAYEVLSDPVRRQRYNETGHGGDSKQADAVQKHVAMLSQIILNAVQQNPLGCNPVQTGRDIINGKIEQLNRVAQLDREAATRLRHIASNVIKNGEGDNMVAAVLESHAGGGESHATKLDKEASVWREVLKLLDDYRWKPDGERGQQMYRPPLNTTYSGSFLKWETVS